MPPLPLPPLPLAELGPVCVQLAPVIARVKAPTSRVRVILVHAAVLIFGPFLTTGVSLLKWSPPTSEASPKQGTLGRRSVFGPNRASFAV